MTVINLLVLASGLLACIVAVGLLFWGVLAPLFWRRP